MNRVGAGGRRYQAARQAFLLAQYHSPFARRVAWEEHVRKVPCASPVHADTCSGFVDLHLTPRGTITVVSGHVHHIVARSRAPGRRGDPRNLALVSPACHRLWEKDKGGTAWNAARGS